MRMRTLDRKVLRDAWHLRGQLAAVAVVVACGIALFVTLRSMHGHLRESLERYYTEYRFADVFARVKRAPDAVRRQVGEIPGVAAVETRVVADVVVDVPGLAEPATAHLVSLSAGREPALDLVAVRRGRRPFAGRRDEALVSDAFARANGLAVGDALGAVINGRWHRLRIVGTAMSPEFVYEIAGEGAIFPDNRRFGVLWLDEAGLADALQMRGAWNDLAVSLAPGASERDVVDRLDALLARYGGRGAYGRADHVSHRFVTGEIEETQVTSIIIPAIFLGVTVFLLHTLLLRLVGTQRDQLAVLKAFGYPDGTIAWHVVKLAVIPVVIGGAAGVALGVWFAGGLAGVYARFFQFPVAGYAQDARIVLAALAIAAAAALTGALSAARRASRLAPAEAMRPEAPARYRRGLVERLRLRRVLSPAWRIVVRNLERRPGREATSMVGIALAGGLVVAALYAFDAIAEIRRLQFEVASRADVMVAFDVPRPAAALRELAHLPGVVRVEGYRSVPVRLRAAHRQSLTALLGLSADAELDRIVSARGVPIPPPGVGLLLSARLARRLGVSAGDSLGVEVLEGARPVRRVAVAGVVDDLVGISAYAERGALDRLLGESPVVSGAYLAVDPLAAAAVHARLKTLPGVSGVIVHAAVLEGFDRTIAESFGISLTTTIAFACVIVFGVVYNAARIALSERGRELASLRVLGFSRREVGHMLLGEQAVIVAAAVPLGLLAGLGYSALLAFRFQSDLFRIPFVARATTYAISAVVVILSAAASALLVRRRLDRLDLVSVLKTRE